MPIVDGLSSTKMIRAFEGSEKCPKLSPLATRHGRVPIFAVSASLVEREKPLYVEAGFDGWILKPIDFKRLNVLLEGIYDDDTRNKCLYQPGEWEKGGWFATRTPEVRDSVELGVEDLSSSEDITPTGPPPRPTSGPDVV
jgi:DNA-binding response OmpR family regulator